MGFSALLLGACTVAVPIAETQLFKTAPAAQLQSMIKRDPDAFYRHVKRELERKKKLLKELDAALDRLEASHRRIEQEENGKSDQSNGPTKDKDK